MSNKKFYIVDGEGNEITLIRKIIPISNYCKRCYFNVNKECIVSRQTESFPCVEYSFGKLKSLIFVRDK